VLPNLVPTVMALVDVAGILAGLQVCPAAHVTVAWLAGGGTQCADAAAGVASSVPHSRSRWRPGKKPPRQEDPLQGPSFHAKIGCRCERATCTSAAGLGNRQTPTCPRHGAVPLAAFALQSVTSARCRACLVCVRDARCTYMLGVAPPSSWRGRASPLLSLAAPARPSPFSLPPPLPYRCGAPRCCSKPCWAAA
jgi:hypothetical protein